MEVLKHLTKTILVINYWQTKLKYTNVAVGVILGVADGNPRILVVVVVVGAVDVVVEGAIGNVNELDVLVGSGWVTRLARTLVPDEELVLVGAGKRLDALVVAVGGILNDNVVLVGAAADVVVVIDVDALGNPKVGTVEAVVVLVAGVVDENERIVYKQIILYKKKNQWIVLNLLK